MKMAKPSKDDMEMAGNLMNFLSQLERGEMPECADADNDELFDAEDAEDCRQAINGLLEILDKGNISRVICALYVLMDPRNKIIDQDADTLEFHPSLGRD
jgi:hypothetical protein